MLKKDERFQLQFDSNMLAWLRATAEKRRCSIAQIIRDLILTEMDLKKKH